MTPIRVLVVDDQALVRAGFRRLVDSEDDVMVVGEAASGEEALRLVRETRADVVLMDVRMTGVDGIEATRMIAADEDLAGVRVLILTTFDHDDYIIEALRAGASGFLVKDTDPEELLHAIRVVARGDALLSPSVTRRLIAQLAGGEHTLPVSRRAIFDVLTEREREVVVLAAQGMSNDEIADALYVSPTTAKTHVSRALVKLGARDRAQLVAMAYRHGLMQAPPR